MSAKSKTFAIASCAVLLVAIGVLSVREWKIQNGKRAFAKYGCGTCHENGAGPNLESAFERRDREFLVRFISDPDSVYAERTGVPLNENYGQMPTLHVARSEARDIVLYLKNR